MADDERVAFIRHMAESPDDRTPRLIFADGVEEHGDPERAELIRVQCSMTYKDHLYPPVSPLLAREGELLARFQSRWLAELPTWATANDGFYRGFPNVILATADDFLIGGAALADRIPLNRIRVVVAAGPLAPLGECSWLRDVRTLWLEGRVPPAEDLRAFFEAADLQSLGWLGMWTERWLPPGLLTELRKRFGTILRMQA